MQPLHMSKRGWNTMTEHNEIQTETEQWMVDEFVGQAQEYDGVDMVREVGEQIVMFLKGVGEVEGQKVRQSLDELASSYGVLKTLDDGNTLVFEKINDDGDYKRGTFSDESDGMVNTEDFDFNSLEGGDTLEIKVEARDGVMMDSDTWVETIEFEKEQNLSAQSRKESYEFGRAEDGRTCYLRFSAHHSNNLGFVKSKQDKSQVEFDAMWQDIIEDDRDWYAVGLKKAE